MIRLRRTSRQTAQVDGIVGGSSWVRASCCDSLWHGCRSGGADKLLGSLTKSRDNTIENCTDVDATGKFIFRCK